MKFLFPERNYSENSQKKANLPMITLLLMISFATFNAVLFTPALPNIAHYFSISDNRVQLTITWFLIGYTIGQLLYGPLANRFGRKSSLYAGISIQIVSSFLCILGGLIHSFFLLVLGRFFMAVGSGAGLTIAFILVNEALESNKATQKISYLTLALAIMPGLSVAIGGILNHHFGWFSCFYANIAYGLVLLFLTIKLKETHSTLNLNALKFKYLIKTYFTQLQNPALVFGGLLMGGANCFIYVFTTLAPFIAIKSLGMNSDAYGRSSILLTIGYVIGCLSSAQLAKNHSYKYGIRLGITIAGSSLILMAIITWFIPKNPLLTLFFPMILITSGLPLVYSNASTFAMSSTLDKAHGAAIMSFISLCVVTLFVLSLSLFSSTQPLLLIVFALLIIGMVIIYKFSNLKNH